MAISIAYDIAIQNKNTTASYSVSSTTLPQLNDYVIIIASYQASGNASIGSDSTGGAFTVLQTQTTTGVSSTMFGRKITTAPSGGSYSATVTMPSNQAQTYHMIYLRGSNIVASNGGSFPENSTTSFTENVSRGSTSTISVYMSSTNGASAPSVGSSGTLIDSTSTTGKGGSTNVGSAVAYTNLPSATYAINFTGLSGSYGLMLYREFYENDTTPPANPTGVTESHTETTATLNWTNPTDTDYSFSKVYRNSVLVSGNITNHTFSDSGLTGSTTYTYKITSVDTFGNESTGTTINVTTSPPDTFPPAEVTSLATSQTKTSVTFTWVDPTDIDLNSIKIYRDGVLINTIAKGIQTYTDSSLTSGTNYAYKLTTVDLKSNESTGTTVTVDFTPPAEVTGLSEVHTDVSVYISWANPTDGDFNKSKVYRDGRFITSIASSETSYSTVSLNPSTSYTFKVTTVDTLGNESAGSTISVTTDASPTQTTLSPTSGGRSPIVSVISVEHSKMSDETGFDTSKLSFKFDTDVTAWEVRVIGAGQGTGTLADSGGSATANTQIDAIIDWTELYQEGQNQVNIYGQNNFGWTPFQDNGSGGTGTITIYIYGATKYGTSRYGM